MISSQLFFIAICELNSASQMHISGEGDGPDITEALLLSVLQSKVAAGFSFTGKAQWPPGKEHFPGMT